MTQKAPAPPPALSAAVELLMAGRLQEAQRAIRKLLQSRPDLPEVHMLAFEVYSQLQDAQRAREASGRVLRLRPGWTEANIHVALGDLFGDFGRYDEAEARYRRALELKPDLTDARFNLASALFAAGRVAQAIEELKTLLEFQPDAPDARQKLVQLLQEERRYDEMDAVCREAMARDPSASFYPQKLGVALWRRGRCDEALVAYRAAAERSGGPGSESYQDARLLEASLLLTMGRYAEGWEAYRWRYTRSRLAQAHPDLIPADAIGQLDEAVHVKVLAEQGLGDEIFFTRFAVELRRRGCRISVVCEPKLAQLLAAMPELIESVNDAAAAADITLSSADLPIASGLSDAPPLGLPFDAARRSAWEARLRDFGPPPYLGVTWRSGILPDEPKPQRGLYWSKEVPLEQLANALRAVDARCVIVQRRPAPEELRRFAQALGRPVLDASPMNNDLRDALGLLALLHEYVTVSNTNVHLRAGIAGKSARVLVPTPPEWRWGMEGERSDWFPEFKLYRQGLNRDWEGALVCLGTDVKRDIAAQHGCWPDATTPA
jgi:tetratricopeptide (TPR) repeat protein